MFHFGIVNVLRRSPCTRDVSIWEFVVSVPGGGVSRKVELLNHWPKLAVTVHQSKIVCV